MSELAWKYYYRIWCQAHVFVGRDAKNNVPHMLDAGYLSIVVVIVVVVVVVVVVVRSSGVVVVIV